MRSLRPTLALLAVLAIAALAAGCGSSAEETSGTSGAESPASTSTAPDREAPVGVRAMPCGEGTASGGEVRTVGVSCQLGRELVAGWYKDDSCSSPPGASRTSCRLGAFTCLGVAAGRGIAVTCVRPGRSVSFIAKPR